MHDTEPARRAVAQRYLDVLAALAPPESLLDVRYRTSGGDLARFFIAMHAHDAAARIVRIGETTDIYVGCAPRQRRCGRRDALAPTALAWVDCDTPAASRALASFIPAPSMIVTSGTSGHAHGYWALAQTLTVDRVEQINRALAAALDADMGAVTAPTAVLRVPGTMNFKQQPPQPVQLRRCGGRRYTLAEMTAAAPLAASEDRSCQTVPSTFAGRGYRQRADGDPLLEIPPAHYVSVLIGRQPGRDRKIECPFHEDRTPSFHVYPTAEEGWTCFGCKARNAKRLGGDIYTLASLLWGIPASGTSFFELRDRLDEAFSVTRG